MFNTYICLYENENRVKPLDLIKLWDYEVLFMEMCLVSLQKK